MRHSKKNQSDKIKSGRGIVRIIGGQMRGRKITFAAGEGLRPTLDRVRETVFNWLARDIAGSRCLDLFSGSGALGFEAVSRYAKEVVFVEKSRPVADGLKSNCQQLQINNAKVYHLDAESFINQCKQSFEIVFLDPPFGKAMLSKTFDLLEPILADEALVYVEQEKSEQPYEPNEKFQCLKNKSSGNFNYALYLYSKQ